MTTIKTFIGTVALLAASTVFAQTGSCEFFPKGDTDGQGTIGRRYAEGYLSLESVSHTTDDVFSIGAGGNLPLCKGIDLGGSIAYSSFKPDDFSTTLTHFDGNVKLYNKIENDIKPFVIAGLGLSMGDVHDHSTNWINWSVGIGAEFPYKWISVTPSIIYRDDFRHRGPSTQSMNYAVDINSWATPQIGVFSKIAAIDKMSDRNVELALTVGVRVRF